MTIALRQLGTDDWRAVRAVRLTALADAPGSFFASLAEAEALPDDWWRDLLSHPTSALWGAYDGDRLVGLTGAFRDRDDPSGRTAAFGMTWLDPAYRGRGVARLYYDARIAWARTRGFARVEVSHRASNIASRKAMIAAGFRQIGVRPHRWPDGVEEDDLLYELTL